MANFLQKIGMRRGHIENDLSKCIYCRACQKNCVHKAIKVDAKTKMWTYDETACYRCKVCTWKCPQKSLVIKEK